MTLFGYLVPQNDKENVKTQLQVLTYYLQHVQSSLCDIINNLLHITSVNLVILYDIIT